MTGAQRAIVRDDPRTTITDGGGDGRLMVLIQMQRQAFANAIVRLQTLA
jgi:hypothetical protein